MSDATKIVLLCPGQGAQHVGMAAAWRSACATAAKTFDEADSVLGYSLSKLCTEGPEDQLNRTDFAQPALYTAAVAAFRGLREMGKLDESAIAATAGLSLGEFTALHLAGAFDFATGLRLVQLRGRAMQDAAERSDSGMVALVGATEEQAAAVCRDALADPENKGSEVLVPANFNCPGQIVISGSKLACTRAVVVAEKMGLRATALTVAGAFHSPLMQPAADKLAAALDEVQFAPLRVPVLSNVSGQPHDGDAIAIKRRLVEQLTSPVRWEQDCRWLAEHVPGRYIELAPGKVLSGLYRRIDRNVKVENAAEPPAQAA